MAIIREERIGDCRLILGDCLAVMPLLGKVDAVVTDPPYLLTYGGHHGSLGGKLSVENYDNKGGIVDCDLDWDDFMPHLFAALGDQGHAYVMANNRHVQNLLNSAERAGLKFHNLLVWNKGTATPNRWYMKNLEFTGFFYKGKAFFINDCGSTQLHEVPNPRGIDHPTPKPPELFGVYIENSTSIGGTVLDPFMGSGASMLSCARLGRAGVGIEIDPKHFETACDRLHDEYSRPNLFVTPPKAPEQIEADL